VSKNTFDVVKASFWLIASIIWAQILFGFGVAMFCGYSVLSGTSQFGSCRENGPSILELLTGGMAVALAFSGRATITPDDKDTK